jgi:hypothetical protein
MLRILSHRLIFKVRGLEARFPFVHNLGRKLQIILLVPSSQTDDALLNNTNVVRGVSHPLYPVRL